MSVLRRVDLERREEILRGLERFVRRLKETLPLQEVHLFGSFVTGKIHEGSDIDLVLVGQFTERFQERIFRVLELDDENLPIEPLCYTPEEFDAMIQEGNPFILEVLKTGKRL
jgi:predicted nucleotidyltransferase